MAGEEVVVQEEEVVVVVKAGSRAPMLRNFCRFLTSSACRFASSAAAARAAASSLRTYNGLTRAWRASFSSSCAETIKGVSGERGARSEERGGRSQERGREGGGRKHLIRILQCLALRQRAVETCVATEGAVSARSWVLAGSRGLDAPESGGRAAHLRSSTCPREPSRS